MGIRFDRGMKYIILILFALTTVVASAKKHKRDKDKEDTWHCTVKPFTEEYEAYGSSKTEATYKVKKKCTAKNNEMHCDRVECDGADEEEDSKDWVCSISAFTDKYEAFGRSKTAATFKVTKECKEKHNEMHCKDVKCKSED